MPAKLTISFCLVVDSIRAYYSHPNEPHLNPVSSLVDALRHETEVRTRLSVNRRL